MGQAYQSNIIEHYTNIWVFLEVQKLSAKVFEFLRLGKNLKS